jgi:hypothetical protein
MNSARVMGTEERMSPFKEWYEIQRMKVCGRSKKSKGFVSARTNTLILRPGPEKEQVTPEAPFIMRYRQAEGQLTGSTEPQNMVA